MTLHFGTGVELNGYGILQLSSDGYVRLTLDQFQAIALRHLWSGLDPEDHTSIHEGAVSTHITGYTEWVSETVPAITLGWDWQLHGLSGRARYIRAGSPRSNIMLIDGLQDDLGPVKTAKLLEAAVDETPWQTVVENQIVTGSTCQAVKSDS
ncbi:MAG: DUF4902 domain-containing protein [Acidithiobacillus sp.]|jgi:hypothetical protein|nr:DUF4902 domain-containing protein [Acidithiobacillus sp.]